MALDPVVQTNVSLPHASIRPLNADGTFSLPWRRFFEQSFISGGGSFGGAAQQNTVIEMVNTNTGSASEALTLATQADTNAQSALDAIADTEAFAVLSFSGNDPAPVDYVAQAMTFSHLGAPDPVPVDGPAAAIAFLALAALDRF